MQITIVGRHFDVTEPIKRHVNKKLLKLERYAQKLREAHVILEIQKFRHIAEVTLYLKYVKLTATEESGDMHSSIDKVLGNLHKQLLKLRERLKEHRGGGIGKAMFFSELFKSEEAGRDTQKEKKGRVIKRRFQPKPMSVEEACMELDLFKDNFLMFRDSQTEKINVIYKREDENYGLIVPE
ncbi:MAG: ribosome-associated translation inhibitor RaiA [Candidatus Omnitrophica bacterium]|nr:ribosome-associated translation inhibitor RaiA [Candidatus Omnitrophota bacterium]